VRLILFFLSLSGVILASWALWGDGYEGRFSLAGSVAVMESAGSWAWAVGIALLLADLVLPIPGTVVMSALGFLYGPLVGGLLAAAGGILSGVAGYGVGRLCGEKTARRWLGDLDFEKGRLFFGAGGGWVVALSKSLPILPEVISCMAGLVRMPFGRFLTALACGSLPTGMLFAAIGSIGRDAPAWATALSLVLPALLWLLARRHLSRT
jgi:uncharacterized membrane protein YdjX (TVP38/TMEM64 family)